MSLNSTGLSSSTERDVIRIAFTDFPGPANPDAIVAFLSREFDVVIDDINPQFVFYSVWGYRYLEYVNAIRIFFTGENVHPDFNLCDYAFGFDRMTFEDRYYRCPNYFLYPEFQKLRESVKTNLGEPGGLSDKRFCNFIYGNAEAHPYREELFRKLNTYRKVDSAGRYLNNTGFTVGTSSLGVSATQEKIGFQSKCKFSLAIENSSTCGYTTEKLVHALAANTIPIYWGDPEVGQDFNTERFINCHEFDYRHIVAQPFFPGGVVPEGLQDEPLMAQFRNIMSSEHGKRKRRNQYVWGQIYEQRRRDEIKPQSFGDLCKRGICGVGRRIMRLAGRT